MHDIKTEHAGAKNGGGHWGTRAEAKEISRRKRRTADKRAVRETPLTIRAIDWATEHVLPWLLVGGWGATALLLAWQNR